MTYELAVLYRFQVSCQLARVDKNPSGDEFKHLPRLVEWLSADLTDEQRVHTEEFIKLRAHIFSHSEFDIGRTDIIHHHVETDDSVPHYEWLERHPSSQLPLIN